MKTYMHKIYLLRKNKGFLLVSSYIAILVLVILGVALFNRTIHEHKFATISMDELSARYAAERGIDYAIAELKLNTNFKTHYTYEGPSGVFSLLPQTVPVSPQLANVAINGEGCYASQFPSGDSQFATKIYADPYLIGETVILSKGLSNGQTCLIVTKYVPSSLYRFFIFSPNDFWPAGSYDAGGGSLHSNGYFWFTGGHTYSNIREISTSKYFKYSWNYNIPPAGTATLVSGGATPTNPKTGQPYTWDDIFYNYRYPFQSGNRTEVESIKYLNSPDGYEAGSWGYGLLWQHPSDGVIYYLGQSYSDLPVGTKPEDYILNPHEFLNLGRYACNNWVTSCSNDQLNGNHTIVNNIKIPNYFNTGYSFNKYYQLDGTGYGFDGYRWGYSPQNITKYQFNSQYQYNDWNAFLRTQHAPSFGPTLENVLKDANTGGTHIEPLSIAGAFYNIKAKTDGIDIYVSRGTLSDMIAGFPNAGSYVKIKNHNGDQYTLLENTGGQLIINGQTVFEKKNFVDQSSAETKEVITLDIGKLREVLGPDAGLNQNIIYSNYPLVLTNARDILDKGLTTVCENNIYLHGNYNDQPSGETFKPSSAISGRYIYTLSGTWDYPQTLQYTFHNPDYPNKQDFYCPADNASCITSLVNGGRLPEDATDPSHPEGYNWYALYHDQMTRAVPQDADPTHLGIDPYVYDVAMVGQNATPQVLERWWDYTNPGDNSHMPSSKYYTTREIDGAQIWLESSDFEGSGSWSSYTRRCCGATNPSGGTFSFPCADCYNATTNPAGYRNSSPTPVYSSSTYYNYNTEFADGDVPPGDLLGYSSTIFVELEDNTTNWTKHYNQISMR